MKIGIVWNITSIQRPVGIQIVVNPRCMMSLEDGKPCGRLATIRMTLPRCWSTFYCSVHGHPFGSTQSEWDRYWRLFPDALDRSFIEALPA